MKKKKKKKKKENFTFKRVESSNYLYDNLLFFHKYGCISNKILT